jgi:hypothetical protein
MTPTRGLYAGLLAGTGVVATADAVRARRSRKPTSVAFAGVERTLPTVSLADALRVIVGDIFPSVAKRAIIRRPRVVSVVERFDLDRLVLLLSGAMLARLIANRTVRLDPPARLHARQPLPGTLNHLSLALQFGS